MKQLFILYIFTILSSCSSGQQEDKSKNTRTNNENENLFPLAFSLKNATNILIKEIKVGLPDTTLYFTKLNPKTQTDLIKIKSAYSYGYIKFKDQNDSTYILRPIDYVGETLYKNGRMTFIIKSVDPINKHISLDFSLGQE